ncbi:MAG: helicase [Candidatus Handelsmanbacteria bacterium RIFCSPLOWO2_12_FULL_64_10]|uniref:Helicase n=1 Tax=Handelsmanbacteria sp. (strain RIFCSPLOWO2_12_FULL_64_10) TaxID=1817868 RepID=A0A1F6CCK9_HANXR|nr:MAG: helicase [Candidatus Handelsmanbacteria bacterium RIFCSPLOWO2_12_FULL_64_10]
MTDFTATHLLPERAPRVGELVQVRSRRWLVEEVVKPDRPGQSCLLRLACADDDAQGQSLDVFWDYELDRRILEEEGWRDLADKGFDPPRQFGAFLHTLRWNCVTATDPNLFQSPFRAGIKIDAYQMEPLRKALRLPRVNLFIADDTGLGKTIEAGLIARELLLRKKAKTIVVAVPPSVLEQWKAELEERFGLVFEILDRHYLARVRRERGFGVNPWRTHSRFLISHNLLIDPVYADPMCEWLGPMLPGSLLILDEAHHAAPSSGGRYGIETKFTRAVRDLCGRFEHRLFLSATPHNGHSNSFSTLLELLDPYRFTRGVKVRKAALEEVMVRRLKEDIRAIQGGFPRRIVTRVAIDGLPEDAPELVLSRLLDEYRNVREERFASTTKQAQAAAGLLVVGLQQRLLSSIEAFARSLKVHRRTVERQWDQFRDAASPAVPKATAIEAPLLTGAPDADDERAAWTDEELEAEETAQIEAATTAAEAEAPRDMAAEALWRREQALLDRMQKIAEETRYLPDAKARTLIDWMREHLCPGLPPFGERPKGLPPKWRDRRVLVFTENREGTKRYLKAILEQAIEGTDRAEERIEVIDGLTSATRRKEIQRRFNTDPVKDPLRILLATDAAREGLNFHAHCTDLFHFDLPWNPGRIEQRNGRIDRKLQPAAEVRCHYFVLPQRVEDRVLEVLVHKTKTIKQELGSLSRVIDDDIERRLNRAGIRHRDAERLAREIEAADLDAERKRITEEELEGARERQEDLKAQIERCQTLLERSRAWVGFRSAPFRDALSCSLELLGAEPLAETTDEEGRRVWTFPPLDRRAETDPSWAATLDTLRVPRKTQQKLAEWRREAPIRPVIFEDAGVLTEDTVHLHLEQRVVQRLLARFRTQGFIHHDLSRACLTQVADSIPRVLLLGRLSLYGRGAERLHEEIVPVAARWIEPSRRRGPLTAYAAEAESRTLDLLDQALGGQEARKPGPEIERRLLDAAARDIEALLPQLEPRAQELAARAIERLRERGEREARELRETLEQQRKRVLDELARHDREFAQLTLNFNDEERRQIESHIRSWRQRLQQFDRDLAEEPGRIREFYEVRAQRIEPVGLVYLWPETN